MSIISWVRQESHERWQLYRMAAPRSPVALQSAVRQKPAASMGHCSLGAVLGPEVLGSEVVGADVGAWVGIHVSPASVGRMVVGDGVTGAGVGTGVGAWDGSALGAELGAALGAELGRGALQQAEAQR